jgi:hypothetical protein
MTGEKMHWDREQKDRLIRDVEASLRQGVVNQRPKNRWLKPVPVLLALGISAICLALGVFCLVYLLFALVG